MPTLKLHPPRKGKSPNWTIRGTYLGVSVDKSSGTPKRSVAAGELKRLEKAIEDREYPAETKARTGSSKVFVTAAVAYMDAHHSPRFVGKLIKYFGETPLDEIDQEAVDAAAIEIYPTATGATRNRCVYTPVSAIMKNAKVPLRLDRPFKSKGREVTDWISEADALAVIRAADAIASDFGFFLRYLLYTGLRLNEALKLRWEDFDAAEPTVWVRRSKGGTASPVRLRPELVAGFRARRPAEGQGRVWRFNQGGHFKHMLMRAKLAALGLACPVNRPTKWMPPPNRLAWLNFHSFRHTWATWMRRAGADVKDLVATGNWRSERSASRYSHAVEREAWEKVDRLPSIGGKSVESA